jgi:hypothetical protein
VYIIYESYRRKRRKKILPLTFLLMNQQEFLNNKRHLQEKKNWENDDLE